ncbi:unnamed protein product, partial [Mesorhabditis spiculigera]
MPRHERRSSRSPKRDRSRDRHNRRRSRSRDRDRRDKKSAKREYEDEPEKKVVDLRQKLRDGLASASVSLAARTATSTVVQDDEVTLDERGNLSRVRQIEAIDSESPFRPKQFKSTAGGGGGRAYGDKKQQPSKAQKAAKKEDAHEDSIFGPTKPQTLADIAVPKEPTQEPQMVFHQDLSADPKMREARWLELWKERRMRHGVC